jgi:hypothetical protein
LMQRDMEVRFIYNGIGKSCYEWRKTLLSIQKAGCESQPYK